MTNYLEKIKINNTEYEIRAPRAKGDEDGNNIKSTYMTKSPATASTIGGVKIGDGINVANDGTISASNKADKDLSNISSIASSFITLLKNSGIYAQSYSVNGSDGYIIFSNKICLQWGSHPTTASTNGVTLQVTMADTNYIVLSNRTDSSGNVPKYTKTTTSIKPIVAWACDWLVIGLSA